jgi:hypothetical protein
MRQGALIPNDRSDISTYTQVAAGTITVPPDAFDHAVVQLGSNASGVNTISLPTLLSTGSGSASLNPRWGKQKAITLYIAQDGTGGRTVRWGSNVVWIGNAVQTISLTANAISIVRVFTVDAGVTWYAEATSASLPGMDPNTVAGVTDIIEAWSLPYGHGETISATGTAIPARKGTAMAAVGTVTFKESIRPAKLTQALDTPAARRPFIDCSAAGSGISLTRAIGGAAAPFTLFLACVMPADTFNGTYFGDVNGTGRRYSVTNAGTSISSELGADANYSNWTQQGSPSAPLAYDDGTPLVITFAYDGLTTGEPFTMRINGVPTTRTNGAAATSNAAITGLLFSKAAPSGWADGALHISGVVLAAGTLLASTNAVSPVQMIERWLASSMGLSI